jgi:hypothetical protein
MIDESLPLYMDQINSTKFIKHANYVYRPYSASVPCWLNDKIKEFPYLIPFQHKNEIGKSGIVYTNGNVDLLKFIDSLPDDGCYIVITRNNDLSLTQIILDKAKSKKSIKRWYGINIGFNDPLFVPVPVGCGTEGGHSTYLEWVAKETQEERYKDKLVYCRVNATGYNEERRILIRQNESNPIFNIVKHQVGAEEMFRSMKKHIFSACPAGEGRDCLRTYETIILGGIPIWSDYIELRHFQDLPVVYTNDWNIITKEWCENALNELKNRTTSTDRMRMSYWDNHIKNSIQELLK